MSERPLPLIELFIHPRDLIDLKSDIWNDEPVDGTIKISGKRHHINVNYRGSHIRKLKKKSYFMRSVHPKLINGVKEIHLNAEYVDPSLMRNKLSLDFFQEIGVMAPSSKYINLKLNGRNEGVYLLLDSVDAFFLQARNRPPGSIFYAVDDDANFSLMGSFEEGAKRTLKQGYEQKCGSKSDLNRLEEFIYITNTIDSTLFKDEIEGYLDTEVYLKWLAGVVCTQNFDGFVHNYSLYLNGESGLFEIMPWDFDATWGRDINGHVMPFDYVRCQGFNTLSARLLDLPYYQDMYMAILREILEGKFTDEYMSTVINDQFNMLLPYVREDPYLKNRYDQFLKEPEYILKFISNRNKFLKDDLETWSAGLSKS